MTGITPGNSVPLHERADVTFAVVGNGLRLHYAPKGGGSLCSRSITRRLEPEEVAGLLDGKHEVCARCIRVAEDRAQTFDQVALAGEAPAGEAPAGEAPAGEIPMGGRSFAEVLELTRTAGQVKIDARSEWRRRQTVYNRLNRSKDAAARIIGPRMAAALERAGSPACADRRTWEALASRGLVDLVRAVDETGAKKVVRVTVRPEGAAALAAAVAAVA